LPHLKCVDCSHLFDGDDLAATCELCGSSVIILDEPEVIPSREELDNLPPGVWRFRAFLPKLPSGEAVSLGEGGTPLLRAERLGGELGLDNLLIKDESRNPTGSFIDRGSTVLVSLARRRGFRECSCVTTGNLGASLSAYCAKAGMPARIRIQPSTDRGKLYQMLAYGAQIEATSRDQEWRPEGNSLSVTAGNPYILEGEKTTGFEMVHDLGWKTPDLVVVPVGTGGHLSMIWRAIGQLRECGLVARADCRLLGVQLEGSAPILGSRKESGPPQSPFTELEESEPFFRKEVLRAIAESRGMGLTTTTNEAIKATGLLARTEGIFAEPASASAVAAIQAGISRGFIRKEDEVVCVITGAGLKDTKAVSRLARVARRVAVREDYTLARMQIGETKLELLRLLASRPSYGYEMWQLLSHERRITTASVYQHLIELEAFALVRRAGSATAKGRERVLYSLTRRGSDFLRIADRVQRTGERGAG